MPVHETVTGVVLMLLGIIGFFVKRVLDDVGTLEKRTSGIDVKTAVLEKAAERSDENGTRLRDLERQVTEIAADTKEIRRIVEKGSS